MAQSGTAEDLLSSDHRWETAVGLVVTLMASTVKGKSVLSSACQILQELLYFPKMGSWLCNTSIFAELENYCFILCNTIPLVKDKGKNTILL